MSTPCKNEGISAHYIDESKEEDGRNGRHSAYLSGARAALTDAEALFPADEAGVILWHSAQQMK